MVVLVHGVVVALAIELCIVCATPRNLPGMTRTSAPMDAITAAAIIEGNGQTRYAGNAVIQWLIGLFPHFWAEALCSETVAH